MGDEMRCLVTGQVLEWWTPHIHEIKEPYKDEWLGTLQPGWYYADETGSLNGPFPTRQEAVDAIRGYAQQLSGDPSDAT